MAMRQERGIPGVTPFSPGSVLLCTAEFDLGQLTVCLPTPNYGVLPTREVARFT
jgi:hypothetical protein